MAQPDFIIAGGGIIGLSLALELDRRGARVTVLEAGAALQQTSSAAAGMLAVHDPANPVALTHLAELSVSLYPEFLDRIAELSGIRVPFQTTSTLEETISTPEEDAQEPSDQARLLVPQLAAEAPAFKLVDERSVDPRQLAGALLAAVRASAIDLREHAPLTRLVMTAEGVQVRAGAEALSAGKLIDCMGAWSPAPVSPRKGQMLAVAMPDGFDLATVVRTKDVYIVPRTEGPNAGRLIIGATIEDAGFDLTVHALDILTLNARATRLLPGLAGAAFLESWSGLRPATADGLPLLGAASAAQPNYILANGHFRNGILLAPATATVISQIFFGEDTAVDLRPFDPQRPIGQSRTE